MSETVSAHASCRPPPSTPTPTLFDLFIAFALIALCGFGGVLAWSRRMLVEERKWMTAQEFDDAYALCQFLPGPNVSIFRRCSAGASAGRPGRRWR